MEPKEPNLKPRVIDFKVYLSDSPKEIPPNEQKVVREFLSSLDSSLDQVGALSTEAIKIITKNLTNEQKSLLRSLADGISI